jgi:DEAD/DEAH box helicase domain-containing protein
MYTEVIFDLETQKFFDEIEGSDPADLGVSILSMYVRTLDENFNEVSGEMISFYEPDLAKAWDYFKKADRIIGFNSKHFDVPALKNYLPLELNKIPHLDILEHVKEVNGKRVSLNAIVKETLGDHKADDPANAIKYWAKRDEESLKKLKFYCEEDVRLTKEIYDYGLKNKKLSFKDYWNDIKTIDVDFSYPEVKAQSEVQDSLF